LRNFRTFAGLRLVVLQPLVVHPNT
jgi:hypothetical protein